MRSSATARVTAAVLTYNGRELLEVVLPSLASQSLTDFRTLVVDNGSEDDSVSWLRENWPHVEVVALPENVGVTAALNVCLRESETEFVALLNNDIELDPDALAELVAALDAHPQAGSASAKLIDFYDRGVIDGAGDIFRWTGGATRRGKGARDLGQFEHPRPIFGACGGAALYRRSAIVSVGLFDEQLFALSEDVDWSFRAQLRGYSCRYVPSAVVYHMGSVTIGQGLSDFTLFHTWRNGIWGVAKNYPATALLRHGPAFLGSQARTLVWALQNGRTGVFARAWREALRGMPEVLRKRRAVQRSRTAGLRELERVIGVDG